MGCLEQVYKEASCYLLVLYLGTGRSACRGWSCHTINGKCERVKQFNDYECFLCNRKLKLKEKLSCHGLTSLTLSSALATVELDFFMIWQILSHS